MTQPPITPVSFAAFAQLAEELPAELRKLRAAVADLVRPTMRMQPPVEPAEDSVPLRMPTPVPLRRAA